MMAGRIALLKAVDSLLGRMAVPLVSLFPLPAKRSLTIRSILLIRPGGIGDAVHLIPAIRAIKERFPAVEITVLAERRNASSFELCPGVDHVLLYDRPRDLINALRGSYDAVIDSEQWHRLSAVVVRLTRAPLLVGFATNERARLFTHQVVYSHDDYEVDSFLNLLAPLGIEPTRSSERFLVVPEDADRKGAKLLAPLGGRRFVTIFPGASIRERRWGAERFGRLAQLLGPFGIAVVVVGGGEERGQGEIIVTGGLGLNLAGRTTLAETAAVIERSALLVSGDSGVLHIGVGLGKPTVSLFGPGRARKWAPRGDRHIMINRGLPCSPCTTFGTTPPCPIDARCMRDIGVEEVFNAVAVLLTPPCIRDACMAERAKCRGQSPPTANMPDVPDVPDEQRQGRNSSLKRRDLGILSERSREGIMDSGSANAIPPSSCKRGWLEVGAGA